MLNFIQNLSVHGFSIVFALVASVTPHNIDAQIARQIITTPQTTNAKPKSEKLTTEEIMKKSESMQSGWSASVNTVKKLLSEAKKKKNIMRTNCIAPKLQSIKFWTGEGRSSFKEIKSMYKHGNSSDRLNLLYQKISVINSNIEEQVLEASRCVGDEQFSSGEGFELKQYQPEIVPFDPENPIFDINYENIFKDNGITPDNPDWSIGMTWPNASPYK